MEFLDSWNCEEFAEYLHKRGVHDDLIQAIVNNRIDSGLFLNLTEDDLKDLAPVIGDRVCLRKILEEARKVGVLRYFINNFMLLLFRPKLVALLTHSRDILKRHLCQSLSTAVLQYLLLHPAVRVHVLNAAQRHHNGIWNFQFQN